MPRPDHLGTFGERTLQHNPGVTVVKSEGTPAACLLLVWSKLVRISSVRRESLDFDLLRLKSSTNGPDGCSTWLTAWPGARFSPSVVMNWTFYQLIGRPRHGLPSCPGAQVGSREHRGTLYPAASLKPPLSTLAPKYLLDWGPIGENNR